MASSSIVDLRASHLTKRYGRARTLALDDVSLDIDEGSIVLLMGPNGAGKSTLLRTWAGFEKCSSGRATVLDRDPWTQRQQVLRQVGYMPQQPALYRQLTVGEHLAMARHYRPVFDTGAALDRLDGLGISIHERAGRLSGGQQAQLALVLALGTQAKVLLLDEPLASLDPLARVDFLRVLATTAQGLGATVVVSSHAVVDLSSICSMIVVLAAGRVRYANSKANALSDHRIVELTQTAAPSHAIGTFADVTGRTFALVAAAADGAGVAPTLEQVGMGYLTRREH